MPDALMCTGSPLISSCVRWSLNCRSVQQCGRARAALCHPDHYGDWRTTRAVNDDVAECWGGGDYTKVVDANITRPALNVVVSSAVLPLAISAPLSTRVAHETWRAKSIASQPRHQHLNEKERRPPRSASASRLPLTSSQFITDTCPSHLLPRICIRTQHTLSVYNGLNLAALAISAGAPMKLAY